jgi:uncharacterized protein involved in exopolysaccharide biosynthesis
VQPGSTFAIGYTGFTPAQAQMVTRKLAETLILDHNQQRSRTVKDTRQFLDSERKQLAAEVSVRETALKDFLAVHPEAANTTMIDPQAEDASVLLLEQELTRLRSQARAQGAPTSKAKGVVRSNAELAVLRRQAEVEREKAEGDLQTKLDTLTDAHPDVIVARERLKRADGDVTRFSAALERAGASTTATPEDDDLHRSIKDIEGRVNRMRTATRNRNRRDPKALQQEVQLGRLRHDLEESRKRLSQLEEQQLQVTVVEKMETGGGLLRLTVLDPASLPGTPLQSRRRRIALVGMALAGLLAAGAAMARAMTNDRLFDRADLAQLANVGVLAVVPRIPRGLRRSDG